MVGHGKRGGGSSSKTPAKHADQPDDSFIVFSNTKDDVKPKASQSGPKKEGDGAAATSEEAAKKPDTRTVIGGASWTGKLPVNLLAEHCQKQRWEKPEYTMTKTPEGFSSMVILKAKNPKTKEMVALPPFKLPPTHKHLAACLTAVEARHFAATYALFRVCSMRNIHMMLPPTYRDLWKGEFQELKKADVKEGRGWMYEADPFASKQEREEAQNLMAKKREEKEKYSKKLAEQSPGGTGLLDSGSNVNRTVVRGWAKVPKIDMGKRTRAQLEDLVRKYAIWNPHGTRLSPEDSSKVVNELSTLGFRKSHVAEAIETCKDREEVLEWLLIHVPEDDLPTWSLPEGYSAGVSMASGNIKREAAVKRLAEAGYSLELCEMLYDKHQGDESRAAEALQNMLLGTLSALGDEPSIAAPELQADGLQSDTSAWEAEQETLEAIFGSRHKVSSPNACQIELDLSGPKVEFSLNVGKSQRYPEAPPFISVISPRLPAYIRLSIIRQCIDYAKADLLDQPMVFNLVDWLESNIPRIVENPGTLQIISAGVSMARNLETIRGPKNNKIRKQNVIPINWQAGNARSLELLTQLQRRKESGEQRRILSKRQALPAWEKQDDIVEAVNRNQVTIISGETGSGKSTQAVQFILDDMIQRKLGSAASIICTQPRRISAIGLADRVSDERCSVVGNEVGYAIRGESKQRHGITKITFVTTGVLLRRLQSLGNASGDMLSALADVSHVFIDEVHERSLDTDFLLILLRDILKKRNDLKVVLMSATLDAAVFEQYFNRVTSVGKVEIEGRTFPVEDFYLDDILRMTNLDQRSENANKMDRDGANPTDSSVATMIQGIGMRINYDLIAETVRAIDKQLGAHEGGILIFLPGTAEISRTIDAIRAIPNTFPLPLHASLTSVEQKRVFLFPPKGKRKIIAATNVAETSITIEDIVAVIDTGKVKETSFDPQTNMVKLEEVWASRAACKQRRGRAGRVSAGKCYKLFTRNAEVKMSDRPDPEIRRVPLEQLCLSVRALGVVDVPNFLGSALTPPSSTAVTGAIDLLTRIGALDGNDLTALGRHLASIPADLRCGKLMVYGATFGCLEPCLTIAAVLTVKSPFVSPQNKREESKTAKSSFAQNQGDLIGDLRAYEEWDERRKSTRWHELRMWCDENFMSFQTLNDISSNRSQYLSSLKEAGFIPTNYSPTETPALNSQQENYALIRALVAGSFNPQLARIEFPDKKYASSMSGAIELDPEARTIKYFNQENGRVFVHPSSTLFDAQSFLGNAVYMSYFTKMATSKIFIRDLTPFNAYTSLLFSGPVTLDTLGRGLLVDGWLRIRGWARIGVLVNRLRMMFDEVLAQKIESPDMNVSEHEVVACVRKLVELDGLDR